ncbi:MAG: NAD(P)/FAD-dependent oxidoreductase [Pseudomonadota bacterium]
MASREGRAEVPERADVVIVGAGFAGMYLLKLMREAGLDAVVLEQGMGVGGTWYWNRYPGARCDVESIQYSHKYLPELEQEWNWSERYAPQPEILAYAEEIADRLDVWRSICFGREVKSATWDDTAREWTVTCETGEGVTAPFYIMATGCLSVPNKVAFPGKDSFQGDSYQTGLWPHEGVDFTGKRVAVIGTGSSAIQSIPNVARQAAELIVFQRTPNYAVPAQNRDLTESERQEVKANYGDLRRAQAQAFANIAGPAPSGPALALSREEQWAEYQRRWDAGGLLFNAAYTDVMVDKRANEIAADFVRSKIHEMVDDPATADLLSPHNTLGAKRLCVDIGYFQTYNLPHVSLVDISENGVEITETGVTTGGQTYEVDAIVYATGFDAMTGALLAVDIRGREGQRLKDAWADGPKSYLGLAVAGFPNLFTVTGPMSPSVFTNMIPSIEQHCEWITECISALRAGNQQVIEADEAAQDAWADHNQAVADAHLRSSTASWYTGQNIEGKPVRFMPYIGGMPRYREKCEAVVANGYEGFHLS